MDNNFKYCEKCEDETYHVDGECRRCVNKNKVIVNIPMHILDTMVSKTGAYKMSIDEAIDRTVNAVRNEIKATYSNWKEETEKRGW